MNRPSTAQTGQKPVSKALYPNLSGVKHIVAIGSGKGGVGKSTVSSNLAMALRLSGAVVGLMDADIYGPSQPGMLGAEEARPGVMDNQLLPISRHGIRFISMGLLTDGDSPVIWRAPMAMKMIQQFIGPLRVSNTPSPLVATASIVCSSRKIRSFFSSIKGSPTG